MNSKKCNTGNYLNVIVLALLIPLLMSQVYSQDKAWDIENRIPEGANRILLKQTAVPTADVYVDAIHHLERKDFEIITSEETFDSDLLESITEKKPLVFSARKQINDTLAIRIMGNVQNCGPTCGLLVASVKYANDVNAPIPNWKNATWNKMDEKNAFFKALEILQGTAYDFMNFEIGVAVTTE
ncbi:MAG: hypothetical protein ACLFQM_08495 [Fidelibacterota bacterium]